jgi:uncharacterized protein YecE (DUF72 family)
MLAAGGAALAYHSATASFGVSGRWRPVAIFIGTAGWSIPRDIAERFPSEGSGLERYAARFAVAEINSSFHRPHRISTWERWRDSVPDQFRFSVKIPKQITHVRRLADCRNELEQFIGEAQTLGEKLAVLLVQLPPSLAFDAVVAGSFFRELTDLTSASIACEPRHLSWFSNEAEQLLDELRVSRVAADPALCEAAARPGGWRGLSYWRLHGSPVIYRSSYGERVQTYAEQMRDEAVGDAWCIFDNTASSAGAGDALALAALLGEEHRRG